jgi:hypothetical protein
MGILNYGYVGQAYAAAATVNYSPTQGNLVKVSVGFTKLTGSPSPSLTDSESNGYTQAQPFAQGSTSGNYLATWYLSNVPAGITSFSVSFAGGTATPYMLVQEYTGLCLEQNGSTALLGHATMAYVTAPGTGANAISSGSFTIGSYPAMLSSVVFDPAANPVTAGTGLTQRFSSAGDALSAGDARFTGTGAQSALWTTANGSDNFLVESSVFVEQISLSNSYASVITNAITCVLTSKAAKAGDLLISYCFTNVGAPTVADSASGTWSTVVKLGGPTGGSRAYSLYRSTRFCASAGSFSTTWSQAGGTSGQISACGSFWAGLGNVSPIDTGAIPSAGALGSSTALLSNTGNNTATAVELVIGIGSTDTSSTSSFTNGNVAGATGISCGMTDNSSGIGPGIVAEFNVVNSIGAYSAAATNTINAHWVMAVDFFASRNLNFPYTLAAGAVTYAYTVESANFNYGPNVYTLLAAPVNYNYSVAQSAADYSLTAGPVVYNYAVQPASGGESGPGIGGTEAQTLLIGIRIGI